MLILSQNKRWIVNMDNVKSITAQPDGDLRAQLLSGGLELLGKYESFDETKGVLEMICEANSAGEKSIALGAKSVIGFGTSS